MIEAKGMGQCIDENTPERFEEKECNEEVCPPNLVCNSKADILFILDGSGSVRPAGFAATKAFAISMASRLNMGENNTKAGVILFSKYVDVLNMMTFDKDDLLQKLTDMPFPRRTTSTSKALSTALDV